MPESLSLFSGLSSESRIALGKQAKASSVGANTVKGPYFQRIN